MANIFDDVLMFHNLPLNCLTAIAREGRARTFHSGEVLMRQGERSDSMYVIMQGLVGVDRSHPALTTPVRVAELGVGETVGEMGLLDGKPRSATVTALEETRVVELSADTLAEVLAQFPEVATSLLHILSSRIRTTDELLTDTIRRRLETAGK